MGFKCIGNNSWIEIKINRCCVGDDISSTAAIYFDFNPAIITNTFETHFVNQLGINEQLALGFAMYPNPASTQIAISLPDYWIDGISKIAIYDLVGKQIKTFRPVTAVRNEVVDISDVATGIYLIEVNSGTTKVTKKLIIK